MGVVQVMAKKTHTLEELRGFLEERREELRKIELDMAKRYSTLRFSEIRALDEKAGKVQGEISRLRILITNREKKEQLKREEKL